MGFVVATRPRVKRVFPKCEFCHEHSPEVRLFERLRPAPTFHEEFRVCPECAKCLPKGFKRPKT